MTEDEAKTKWCVHARYQGADNEPSANSCDGWLAKCIASECMAWRWVLENIPTDEAPGVSRGYCGLAGKP